MGYVGMRVRRTSSSVLRVSSRLMEIRIVEYATREQAQQAVNTLSNQNLMGRLVYVREVRHTLQRQAISFIRPSIEKV